MKIDLKQSIIDVCTHPNVAFRKPIYENYDQTVQGNSYAGRGEYAASMVIPFADYDELPDPKKQTAIATGTGGNPYLGKIDPEQAAIQAMAFAALQTIVLGGIPLGASDCLNFGNPEKPEQMGDFVQSINGLKEAAEFLNIPFVSGNVSLYKEFGNKPVPPSPVISIFAKIQNPADAPKAYPTQSGDLYFVGDIHQIIHFGGSQWVQNLDRTDFTAPSINLELVQDLFEKLAQNTTKFTMARPIGHAGIGIEAIKSILFKSQKGIEFEQNPNIDLANILFSPSFGTLLMGENIPEIFGDNALKIANITDPKTIQINEVVTLNYDELSRDMHATWQNIL